MGQLWLAKQRFGIPAQGTLHSILPAELRRQILSRRADGREMGVICLDDVSVDCATPEPVALTWSDSLDDESTWDSLDDRDDEGVIKNKFLNDDDIPATDGDEHLGFGFTLGGFNLTLPFASTRRDKSKTLSVAAQPVATNSSY